MKLASSLSAAAAAAAFCFVMDWNVSDDEAIDCRIMRTPSEKFEECLQECFPLFLSYFLWLCECVCVCVCVLIQSFVWCINDCGSDAGLAAQRSWNIHFPSYYYPPPPSPFLSHPHNIAEREGNQTKTWATLLFAWLRDEHEIVSRLLMVLSVTPFFSLFVSIFNKKKIK